jgi:hypothetical protein
MGLLVFLNFIIFFGRFTENFLGKMENVKHDLIRNYFFIIEGLLGIILWLAVLFLTIFY